jgi:hypothetical protein
MKKLLFLCAFLTIFGFGCDTASQDSFSNADGSFFVVQEDEDGVIQDIQEKRVDGEDDSEPEGEEVSSASISVDGETSRIDFSSLDQTYRFSATIPDVWKVEYASAIDSINIYDPADGRESIRDKSRIFIRQFRAKDFLTLKTVAILEREETSVKGHDAVRYTIEKHAGVADFQSQPYWRNLVHSLVDIRLASSGKTWFYVFSYHPNLDPALFESFIDSLVFHNDTKSFVEPMPDALNRISKKNFGTEVYPGNSPVENERFSGFHTGVDLEVSDEELSQDVPVRAFCGGEIIQKRTASGYGGLVLQECLHDTQRLVIIYGHLNLASVPHKKGSYVAPGQLIGNLGDHESVQTDGERKHLHFGVYIGKGEDIRGYVNNAGDLGYWVNPVALLTS